MRTLLQRVSPSLRFDSLCLFVTSQCGLSCATCIYHTRLNSGEELSMEELEKLSSTMPQFTRLHYTGGEPLMREDLARITRLFYVHNGVRRLALTTNGQLIERAVNEVCRMLDQNEKLRIDVSISIDGLGESHDRLRGHKGSFDEALRCVRALEPVRDANERLRLYALSVITTETLEELRALAWNLLADFRLDGHYFEPVHGEPRQPELGVVDPAELDRLLSDLEPIHRTYARRRGDGRSRLGTASSLSRIVTRYRLQRGVWESDRPSPLECTAGRTSIVVEHDGAVRACELREVFASLRDFDMDFRALQASQALADEVDAVLREDCRCAHSRSIDESLRWSARGLLWELPRSYLSELVGRRRRRQAPD